MLKPAKIACEPACAAEVQRELERILESAPFIHSRRMSRFLRAIVEATLAGDTGSLKEYSIGCSVFDRDQSFDTRLDPVVRNEARRLRQKLDLYYESNHVAGTIRISLPKGGYTPLFEEVTAGEQNVLSAVSPPQATPCSILLNSIQVKSRCSRRTKLEAILILAAILLICLFLTFGKEQDFSPPHRPKPKSSAAWQHGRRDVESLERPIEAMPELLNAIRVDPRFADPYATLAAAYGMAAMDSKLPMWEGMRKAKELAEQALALDRRSAEAYLMLGAAEVFNRDWTRAEDLMRHALRIRSDDPFSLVTMAQIVLRPQGKLAESAAFLERATQLQPSYVAYWRDLIAVRREAHQYSLAISAAQKALHFHPENTYLKWDLSQAYAQSGDVAKSARTLTHVPLDGADLAFWSIDVALAQHRHADATRVARRSLRLTELDDSDRAVLCAVMGDEEQAISYLNREEDKRSMKAVLLAGQDYRFSLIRSHPKFQQLLRRMRLVPY